VEQRVDKLILPATLVLIAAIAVSLADGVWFFLGGAETAVAAADPSRGRPRPPETAAGFDAERLASLNLFGTPEAEQASLAGVEAPETRLQLELKGVFLARTEQGGPSGAIIAARDQAGQLYRVGDTLPGNARLAAVFANRVLLRRSGSLEALRFDDEALAAGFVSTGPAPATASQAAPAREAPSAPVEDAAGDTLRARMQRYEHRLEEAPAETLSELGVEPVESASGSGYRLGSKVPEAALARMGLRPGDVVLSVNGEPLGDPGSDRQRLSQVLEEGAARLEIQRGDRRFFVTTRLK